MIADIEDHLETRADEALFVAGCRASEFKDDCEPKHEAQSANHALTNDRAGRYANDDRARQQTKDWIEELENSVETLTVRSRNDPNERRSSVRCEIYAYEGKPLDWLPRSGLLLLFTIKTDPHKKN